MNDCADRHPEHDAEQAHLRAARAALDAMVDRSDRAVAFSEQRVRDEESTDARVARTHLRNRRDAVDVGDVGLCFGRIDEDPTVADGASWYVGRRHIEHRDGTPVVIDWRAPVAIPFYRATTADPFDLALRRRFVTDVDELIAIFDERLDDPESAVATGVPDPVLAEIERGRSGEMADIVATIAAEQDEIIRAPLDRCLLVQGGPGTGKTAVGLHRAAFLLFEHRAQLANQHVLVIGPNRVFLGYVSNVLPSLGESAVTQATMTSLLSARVRVRAEEDAEVAAIKGRAAMAIVLGRLAAAAITPPRDQVTLPLGLRSLRFAPTTISGAVDTARGNRLPLNDAKKVFTEVLLREARTQLLERGLSEAELARLIPDLRRSDGFRTLVDRTWPSQSGVQLVRTLLGSPRKRRGAMEGLFADSDIDMLQRTTATRVADEPWTAADLVLLDEANALTSGTGRTYGHVVIDEAQDLSAMALRAAARRSSRGSMTILGDIAQATGIGAQESWDTVTTALGVAADSVSRRELTVGYRVPGPILDEANRLLPVTAPDITPPTSIRPRGPGPEHHVVSPGRIPATVARLAAEFATEWSTIGIVTPESRIDEVLNALDEAGVDAGDTRRASGLERAVSVVPPPTAKGLEFDVTIVVEPADFATTPNGLRLLYVALTRAVQRLAVVRTRSMPPPLTDRSG